MHSAAAAVETAQKILDGLAQPYEIAGHLLCITPSIGISLFPDQGDDPDTLVRRADIAMYYAKKLGRANVQLYVPGMKT
jgi:GGDEF domain-containing protein